MARITETREMDHVEFHVKILECLDRHRGISVTQAQIRQEFSDRSIETSGEEMWGALKKLAKPPYYWVQLFRGTTPPTARITKDGVDALRNKTTVRLG